MPWSWQISRHFPLGCVRQEILSGSATCRQIGSEQSHRDSVNDSEISELLRYVGDGQRVRPGLIDLVRRVKRWPETPLVSNHERYCSSRTLRYAFRVNLAVSTVGRSLPVHPDEQTFPGSVGMSQRCHFGLMHRGNHSITSLARASKVCSRLRPSALLPLSWIAGAGTCDRSRT
jgi:hypothetical protein